VQMFDVLLIGEGEVWAWGDNYHGQCGQGTEGNEKLVPVRVKGLDDKRIVQIACGDDHTLALGIYLSSAPPLSILLFRFFKLSIQIFFDMNLNENL
jgi:hypothetical protein